MIRLTSDISNFQVKVTLYKICLPTENTFKYAISYYQRPTKLTHHTTYKDIYIQLHQGPGIFVNRLAQDHTTSML